MIQSVVVWAENSFQPGPGKLEEFPVRAAEPKFNGDELCRLQVEGAVTQGPWTYTLRAIRMN